MLMCFDVLFLLFLGFHQSMSMMGNQGQLLFDLENSANDWILAPHFSYFLRSRDALHFWWDSLLNAGLNRPKFQSVKGLNVLFSETRELFGSCDLNADLILIKDCVLRKTFEVLELLHGRNQSLQVWVQPDQLQQLSTGHVRLDFFIV